MVRQTANRNSNLGCHEVQLGITAPTRGVIWKRLRQRHESVFLHFAVLHGSHWPVHFFKSLAVRSEPRPRQKQCQCTKEGLSKFTSTNPPDKRQEQQNSSCMLFRRFILTKGGVLWDLKEHSHTLSQLAVVKVNVGTKTRAPLSPKCANTMELNVRNTCYGTRGKTLSFCTRAIKTRHSHSHIRARVVLMCETNV